MDSIFYTEVETPRFEILPLPLHISHGGYSDENHFDPPIPIRDFSVSKIYYTPNILLS